MLGRRRSSGIWSWDQVRERTLAIYGEAGAGRSRMAVLIWQGDDPRVPVGGSTPPLLAFTMDVEVEADEDNAVALAGFGSLEAARRHCVDWVGSAAETGWESIGEAAQIAVYASIREPAFATEG
jgi:hypothetical protein